MKQRDILQLISVAVINIITMCRKMRSAALTGALLAVLAAALLMPAAPVDAGG